MIYYQAVCGPNTSSWSATSQFTTACSIVTGLDWCEGFDDISLTEQCWTVLNLNNDLSSWDMNTQFDQLDGNNCASINTDFNNGNNEDWLISPQLSLIGTEILTFNYKVLSDLEPNNLKVKISITGNSPADFTQTLLSLDTITNTFYQDTSVNLGSFTGNVYIAFHIPQGGLDGWVLYLDQICIQECVPASIQNDSIEICQSADSLDLTTVLNIGQSIGQWSFNSQPNNLDGSMLQLNGLTTGIYQANYLVNTACQSTSASAYISLYEVSNAGIDSSVVLCKNQPFDLFDALGGSFQIGGTWYDPSNQQLQGSSIVSSNFPGQYNYDYIITNGVCPSDTSNALIIVDDCIFSSVEEINPQSITLYPNPTDGLLSLSMSNECESCILEVTDIDGRVVYMDKIQNTVNGNFGINLERILPGMYYLNLIDANQRTVINFIKK